MAEELWTLTQLACTGIITIGGAGAIIIGIIKWARKPDDTRDETLKKHGELLENDNKRLKALEEGLNEMQESNKVLMKSNLAIMRHLLDGNHKEELQKSMDNLQEYILNR